MTREEMLTLLEKEYLAKIMGFCCRKVEYADAEELASDITLEVLKYIRSGKEIENFNALIWSISNHIFCKWLRRKKYGSAAYLPDSMPFHFSESVALEDVEEEILYREQENLLRREIAFLVGKHRRTIILYYFEGMGCAQIACILGVSVGTVKWWLHVARNSIKEGIDMNREYGEKSFWPETLWMSCQGTPGADNEPMSCVRRKSAQNILLSAYDKPMSIQELCLELGITAPYVEDEVEYLVDNKLMRALSGGKFQTDFVILPVGDFEVTHQIYERCFPEYFDLLLGVLEDYKILLSTGDFNTAGFSWNRLLWVYLHIITDITLQPFEAKVCKKVGSDRIPQRPNGGEWIALGFHELRNSQESDQMGTWKEYIPWDGPVHKMGNECAQGYFHYWSGPDSSIFFQIPEGVFEVCRKVMKKELSLSELTEEQKYLLGIAVERKLLLQEGDHFRQNYYFAGREARKKLGEIVNGFYPTASQYFSQAWEIILAKYEPTVPKELHWQMGNFLSNKLNCFVTCSLYEGMKRKLLSEPDENHREWLSLFAWEV